MMTDDELNKAFQFIEQIDFPKKTFVIGNYKITIEKLEPIDEKDDYFWPAQKDK